MWARNAQSQPTVLPMAVTIFVIDVESQPRLMGIRHTPRMERIEKEGRKEGIQNRLSRPTFCRIYKP